MSERAYNDEWLTYYRYLERLRQSGTTNMYGAAPYLKDYCPFLSNSKAREIVVSWMENYDDLITDGIC